MDSIVPAGHHTSATFSDAQIVRLQSYGIPFDVTEGEILYRVGDSTYDLILIDKGSAEIVRERRADADEKVVAREGAGGILGEMGLLSGQAVYLTARMTTAGSIHRITPTELRRLMADDADLSEILLRTFIARRNELKDSAARSLEIIGDERHADSLSLRTYAARMQLPHEWVDVASDEFTQLAQALNFTVEDLPVVVVNGDVITKATSGLLADRLGLSYRPASTEADLVVIGAGPAGLAAAVYGSSEGLQTVLLDAVGPGGQAASSSRIENYLGFPNGLSGGELTGRAHLQALKFGTSVYSPCEVRALSQTADGHVVELADGTVFSARAVVFATGARYRNLPLDRWAEFEGAGIYYAATEIETRRLTGLPVTVVGGANSAGQAAIFLASKNCAVTLIIRGEDIRLGMSSYLVERILTDPLITVRTGTQVAELHGQDYLDGLTIATGETHSDIPCSALFCFIGAVPASELLHDVAVDEKGFILTDSDIPDGDLGGTWSARGTRPLPFETNIPGLFAVGDVRHGSMKRVAAAVGEGASAVASAHVAIARH